MIIDLLALLGAGALAGLLAGLLGIGGGLVLVPLLALWWRAQGMPDAYSLHLAVACSAASIVATGSASAYAHHRAGRVDWGIVRIQSPGLMLGAWLAALIVGGLPEHLLGLLVAGFCVYAAHTLVRANPRSRASTAAASAAVMFAVAAAIGALSAAVGIGGGSLNVPYLHRHGLELKRAIGTSAAAGIPIALAAALGYLMVPGPTAPGALRIGLIDLGVVALIAAASVPMAPLGAWLAGKAPVAALKQLFAAYLLLVAGHLAWQYGRL